MGAGHAKCRRTWREAEEASLSSKHGIRKRRKGHTFSGVKRLTTRLPECMLQIERESFRLRKLLFVCSYQKCNEAKEMACHESADRVLGLKKGFLPPTYLQWRVVLNMKRSWCPGFSFWNLNTKDREYGYPNGMDLSDTSVSDPRIGVSRWMAQHKVCTDSFNAKVDPT